MLTPKANVHSICRQPVKNLLLKVLCLPLRDRPHQGTKTPQGKDYVAFCLLSFSLQKGPKTWSMSRVQNLLPWTHQRERT